LRTEIPFYESNNLTQFRYYQNLFGYYEQLKLSEINTQFSFYIKKIMSHTLPYNNAKYLLSRLLLIDNNQGGLLLDHSFVESSAKHIELWNSKSFRNILNSFNKPGRSP
jgi:hypothetical protein